MNLKQQRERVTVDGLGNIGVGKWKKPTENTTKTVEKSGNSDIIDSKPPRLKVNIQLCNYRIIEKRLIEE